jgi:hypothetical protein
MDNPGEPDDLVPAMTVDALAVDGALMLVIAALMFFALRGKS